MKELQERFTGVTGIPLNDIQKAYGQLEQLPEGYHVKTTHIDMLDEQNVERCSLPTLGDCVEGLMHDNVPMAYKSCTRSTCGWKETGATPTRTDSTHRHYIPMLDPELAADELEFVLNKGVEACQIQPDHQQAAIFFFFFLTFGSVGVAQPGYRIVGRARDRRSAARFPG